MMDKEDPSATYPFQGEIAKAVTDVMAEVERLQKADDNKFANYRFTSVDDYKDALRPLMSKHGLSIGMRQVKFKMFTHKGDKKESEHCRFDFQIWLKHPSGEQSTPDYTTVCLPYTMAQTTGQARSYALKEWLKSTFLASSGDTSEDADALNYGMKFSKAEARKIYENLTSDMNNFATGGDKEDLLAWVGKNKILLDAMPDDWRILLQNEYKQAEVAIKLRERGEAPDQFDWDGWLTGYENQMAAATTIDDVQEIAVEHEETILNGPSTLKAAANRVYNETVEKLESDEQLI